MIRKIATFLSVGFWLLWVLVVLIQYCNYNPKYLQAFQLFQYSHLLLFFLITGGVFSYLLYRFPDRWKIPFNGLSIFIGICLLDLILFQFYYSTDTSVNKATASYGSHFSWFLGLIISLFSIYLVIRVLGAILFKITPIKISIKDRPIIEAATGSMLLVALLFLLGLIGGIKNFILIPMFLLILVVHWKMVLSILKKTFWKPLIKPKDLNILGVYSFLFLGFFLVGNFVQILRPFPAGTDSLNLYVNLPNLIAQSGSLIDGHQPYNWSLIMALGMTIFGKIEVILGLSFLGAFLTITALFRLCRKHMTVNYSALCLLLFFSAPMVNFLTYMDMKIDMPLAFISLSILLLFYNWIKVTSSKLAKNTYKSCPHQQDILPYQLKARRFLRGKIPSFFVEHRLLILIGLLAGFALGIKLTVLFFFFALMIGIWFTKSGRTGLFASFFLCMAAVFILKLDAQPKLRHMHEGVAFVQWFLLLIGIGLTAFMISKDKKQGIEIIKTSILTTVFFALPIMPWMIKNASETKQFTTQSLINGKKATPILNVDLMKKQLKKNK